MYLYNLTGFKSTVGIGCVLIVLDDWREIPKVAVIRMSALLSTLSLLWKVVATCDILLVVIVSIDGVVAIDSFVFVKAIDVEPLSPRLCNSDGEIMLEAEEPSSVVLAISVDIVGARVTTLVSVCVASDLEPSDK